MLARRTLLRTTRLLLAAFLLAQAGLALAACDWGARDAAMAVAMAAGSSDAPCHESAKATSDSGFCMTHCLGAQQSLDKPSIAVPGLAASVVQWATAFSPAYTVRAARRERPLAAAAPPRRILFQSFLI